jgi:hypothetical protein
MELREAARPAQQRRNPPRDRPRTPGTPPTSEEGGAPGAEPGPGRRDGAANGSTMEHRDLGEGGYLCTNNGVSALLLVLGAVVDHLDQFGSPKPWQATPQELEEAIRPFAVPITEIFMKADLPEIRQYRRQVGNAGQRQAAFAMMEAVQTEKSGFNPEGLADFIRSQDQTGTNTARQLMPELQLTIHDAAIALLRNLFGRDEGGWWRKGVPEKVRTEVAARRETNPEGGAYDKVLRAARLSVHCFSELGFLWSLFCLRRQGQGEPARLVRKAQRHPESHRPSGTGYRI